MSRVREASENAAHLSQTLNDELPQTLRKLEANIETATTAVLICCTVLALAGVAIAITVVTNVR